jgi:hypothetical protein
LKADAASAALDLEEIEMVGSFGRICISACLLISALCTGAEAQSPFKQEFELQGIRFAVEATNAGSINTLKIVPAGLSVSNEPVTMEIDGSVSGAEVADLNVDGFPEIYVWSNSAGSGSYGSLVAYAVNQGKTMSQVYFPPVADDQKHNKGYMGHDDFAVVENTFVQRFPIYKEGDSNSKPTGKTRQLQYKLKQGEAGWKLVLDKAVEF